MNSPTEKNKYISQWVRFFLDQVTELTYPVATRTPDLVQEKGGTHMQEKGNWLFEQQAVITPN